MMTKTDKLLVMALMIATGCAVDPTGGGGPGPGSGSGSGSGSDSDGPGQHPPGALYGRVIDERGDTIDFTSGEPVHTHAGATIDLSTSCPTIYKYAYLMGEHAPEFGHEDVPNPLAWHVKPAADTLDASSPAYRVRRDDGSVLLDWTAMTPDASGVYTIELHRDGSAGIAALGTETGTMHVEARFRPQGGTDQVTSACWVNHPLAAPVAFAPPSRGALFGMSLPASSPLSPLVAFSIGQENGVTIATMPLVQQTAEPIALSIDLPTPAGTATETTADAYLVTATDTTAIACADLIDQQCRNNNYTTTYATGMGQLAGTWLLRVVDDATGAVTCPATSALPLHCTLPPRAASEPPHGYHLELALSNAGALAPIHDPAQPIGDYTAGTTSYTGTPPTQLVTSCTKRVVHVHNGITLVGCDETTTYAHVAALDRAQLSLQPITFDLTSSAAPQGTVDPLGYVGPDALTLAAATWDAGDKGL